MRNLKSVVFCLLLGFVISSFLSGHLLAQEKEKDQVIIVDKERIYYGNPEKGVSNPAVIDSSKIFNNIPAYKKIVDEGLTPKNPKYWILMEEANKVFKASLKKTAKKLKVDLIAEIGAIEIKGKEITDITDEVIEKL